MDFNAKEVKTELIKWIVDWFEINGKGCNAVIGISGGKDSTITAALCVEALGKDRVIGVAMPENGQSLNDADKICDYLGIRFIEAPIGSIVEEANKYASTIQARQNIPPRVRMTTLYAISQSNNGRVSNNCNLSEDYVGYATIFGDAAGDFSCLKNLTVTEIRAIGRELNLPSEWVEKTPDDGLPHSTTDEAKFGFTYEVLDKYIRGIEEPSFEIKEKIDKMHRSNLFKLQPIASFIPKK